MEDFASASRSTVSRRSRPAVLPKLRKESAVFIKIKSIMLPTGEELTYWRSDGGTCTIELKFTDGPLTRGGRRSL